MKTEPRAASWKVRIAIIAGVVALFGALALRPALAVHDIGLFELDENATDGLETDRLGTTNGSIAVNAASFVVCQEIANPTTPFNVLIDEEEITVGTTASASGGGCPQGSVKRTYSNLTRGVGLTDPAAHSNN